MIQDCRVCNFESYNWLYPRSQGVRMWMDCPLVHFDFKLQKWEGHKLQRNTNHQLYSVQLNITVSQLVARFLIMSCIFEINSNYIHTAHYLSCWPERGICYIWYSYATCISSRTHLRRFATYIHTRTIVLVVKERNKSNTRWISLRWQRERERKSTYNSSAPTCIHIVTIVRYRARLHCKQATVVFK